jgi:hypothetical protein
MDKTINLDFRFRKSNNETVRFSESFFPDLRKCLNRFKLDAAIAEKSSAKPDQFVFAFLSLTDNDDRPFINDIIALADNPNTILINIDPFKITDKGFPIHKFKIFRFWEEIKETGETRLFRRDALGNNALYWERITDIAIDIADRFTEKKAGKKGKIFLAQTDNAQSSDRDNLWRDLTEMGFEVVPDRLLSLDFNECTQQINQQLKGCSLIIHPIPLIYTKYFSEKQISLVEHQCMISSQYAGDKQNDVKRIIWIPSDFDITDEENQIFVEKIQRDQNQSQNTLVLKVSLEELKKIYRRIFSGEVMQVGDSNLPEVYVVADNDSANTGEKLMSTNSKSGVAIGMNFKGITYNQHLRYLANSQVVVINYTSDNEHWFAMKVNDIFKSKGIDASKPFKRLILVKGNKELDTSAFESRFSEVHVCSLEDLKLNLAVKNN